MEQEEVNQNLLYIQQKFPDIKPSQLRRYMNFINAGLPEVFWDGDIKFKNKNYQYAINDMLIKNNNGMVFFDDIDIQFKTIATIVRNILYKNGRCVWINYYMLIGRLMGKFGDVNMNSVFEWMNEYRYIFITNIRGGKVYEKNEEHFTLLMENFLYPLKLTNFVLCFDNVENKKDIYGSLYKLLKNSVEVVEVE